MFSELIQPFVKEKTSGFMREEKQITAFNRVKRNIHEEVYSESFRR